jgi:hypothetical protein
MRFLVPLLLSVATPLTAQAQTAAPADPVHAKAAESLVEIMWPLGTYRRMMNGQMTKVMDSMISSMFDMKAGDMAGMTGDKAEPGDKDKSLGQLAEQKDPHFRERMKLTMDTMMAEMVPLMDKAEPAVRAGLARVYARDYTTAQLGDLRQMFSTPTGKLFGERWMMSFADPEMMKAMQSFAPELMQAMPGIIKKVEAATAHLPPPPKEKEAE